MADAFFLPTDDPTVFVATGHTRGPWDPGQQHAGPPSALLTRAVERLPGTLAGPGIVARLTVEILRPVPVGQVQVSAAVARPGRSVELIDAEMTADGLVVLRARFWRVRATELDLPAAPADPRACAPQPPLPPAATPFAQPRWRGGYLDAIEWRFVEGHFEVPGPAVVWARSRVRLVAGEELSPLQHTVVVADSGNGLSRVLDMHEWWFINTELTVHLHRAPVGEWTGVRARSTLDPSGVGLAETQLYDLVGRIGRGAQALLVGVRG